MSEYRVSNVEIPTPDIRDSINGGQRFLAACILQVPTIIIAAGTGGFPPVALNLRTASRSA
jgi:hypothetical protein